MTITCILFVERNNSSEKRYVRCQLQKCVANANTFFTNLNIAFFVLTLLSFYLLTKVRYSVMGN
jgi:hypothetical protein